MTNFLNVFHPEQNKRGSTKAPISEMWRDRKVDRRFFLTGNENGNLSNPRPQPFNHNVDNVNICVSLELIEMLVGELKTALETGNCI